MTNAEQSEKMSLYQAGIRLYQSQFRPLDEKGRVSEMIELLEEKRLGRIYLAGGFILRNGSTSVFVDLPKKYTTAFDQHLKDAQTIIDQRKSNKFPTS